MSRRKSQTGRYQVSDTLTEIIVTAGRSRGEWRSVTVWQVTDTETDTVVSQRRQYTDAQWEADHRNAGTWSPDMERTPRLHLER